MNKEKAKNKGFVLKTEIIKKSDKVVPNYDKAEEIKKRFEFKQWFQDNTQSLNSTQFNEINSPMYFLFQELKDYESRTKDLNHIRDEEKSLIVENKKRIKNLIKANKQLNKYSEFKSKSEFNEDLPDESLLENQINDKIQSILNSPTVVESNFPEEILINLKSAGDTYFVNLALKRLYIVMEDVKIDLNKQIKLVLALFIKFKFNNYHLTVKDNPKLPEQRVRTNRAKLLKKQ